MTLKTDTALWDLLDMFEVGNPNAPFSFTDRLARENGWSKGFTLQAVREYKKFLYLCCTSTQVITPSDVVDQVWHLHLTYTQSYWVDLCQNTLGRLLHHTPTQGGALEEEKYREAYAFTLQAYSTAFSKTPLPDFWESPGERFKRTNFVRVDTQSAWVLKKLSPILLGVLIGALFLVNFVLLNYSFALAGICLLLNGAVPF